MTFLETIIEASVEKAKAEPDTTSPLTMGVLMGAIIEDLRFLNRRADNAEVGLKRAIKELQRVKKYGAEALSTDTSLGAALLGGNDDV